jgi:acyl carrier protein
MPNSRPAPTRSSPWGLRKRVPHTPPLAHPDPPLRLESPGASPGIRDHGATDAPCDSALRAGTRPGADLTRHHGQTDGEHRVTEQEIESKVIDIVAEQMGADKAKITRTTSFVEDLNADSLDTVELVMEFEDEFETSSPTTRPRRSRPSARPSSSSSRPTGSTEHRVPSERHAHDRQMTTTGDPRIPRPTAASSSPGTAQSPASAGRRLDVGSHARRRSGHLAPSPPSRSTSSRTTGRSRSAARSRTSTPRPTSSTARRKKLDRSTPSSGMGAAHEAVAHAGIDFEQCDRERCGVVIGSGSAASPRSRMSGPRPRDKGPDRVNPFTVPAHGQRDRGQRLDPLRARGARLGHATACASRRGTRSATRRYIRAASAMSCSPAASRPPITPLCLGSFSDHEGALHAQRRAEKASRPFDKDRDGFIMAEGGRHPVLESLEHAKARGATIHAELVGFGNSCDATTSPRRTPPARAPPAPCGRAPRRRARAATTSTTSTPTARRPPWATRPRSPRCSGVFGDHARSPRAASC